MQCKHAREISECSLILAWRAPPPWVAQQRNAALAAKQDFALSKRKKRSYLHFQIIISMHSLAEWLFSSSPS
jgi:hypothetical protein